ncbi:MAG: hypothetical protein QM727_01835 [Niabella sp.]
MTDILLLVENASNSDSPLSCLLADKQIIAYKFTANKRLARWL